MRIIFEIEVGIDVPNYAEAGKILDQVTRNLGAVVGEENYDVRSFQTNHTPIRRSHGQMVTDSANPSYDPPMASPENCRA